MEQKQFSKLHIVFYPVIFIVAFLIGSFYGNRALLQLGFAGLMNVPVPQTTTPENTTTLSGPTQELHSVSGIVQAIKDTLVTIKTSDNIVLLVEVNSLTKFQKGVPKDPDTAKTLTSLEPFVRKESSLSEIKTGDLITATSDKNIKDTASFVATEILILQKPNLRSIQ